MGPIAEATYFFSSSASSCPSLSKSIFEKNVFSAILFFKEVVFSLVVAVVVVFIVVVVIINAKSRATRCKTKKKSVRPLFGNRFIFSLSQKRVKTKAVVSKAKPFVEKARNTRREELVF